MRDVAGPTVTIRRSERFHDVPTGKIGNTQITDFPSANKIIEGAQCFLDRSLRIETVQLEKIDVIGAEAFQAAFDRLNQVKARRAHIIRSVAAPKGGLRGNQHLVTPALDRLAQDFLGD